MEIFLSSIGWVGTALVIAAFFLTSNNKLSTSSKWYQLMNIFGSIFVGINVYTQKAWPSFALQVIWGMIAIISLIKILNRKK